MMADRRSRHFIAAFFGSMITAVAGMAAFNYVVDPFQYYHVAKLFRPVLWGGMQRYQNAGLARNYAEDTVVIGSSVTENFLPRDIKAIWGKPATKLSISGSTAHEQFLVLRTALQTGRVKNVLWGLDTGAFYSAPNSVRDDQAPFPWHMYRSGWIPNAEYLLALGTTRLSVAALRGYGETDFDAYHAWYDKFEFGASPTIKAWAGKCESFSQKFTERPLPEYADMEKRRDLSIETNLTRLLRAYPDVKFHLFLPPLATLGYIPAANRSLPLHLPFRTKIAEVALTFPNASVYDFQSDEGISNDLSRFKDTVHFDLRTTREILTSVRDGLHKVASADDMAVKNRLLVGFVNQYDICGQL